MAKPRFWPSAPTLLLAIAACVSGTALSTHAHDGFHPLVIAACMLPLQVAGLVWAITAVSLQRRCR
ncbi:hypothetical protein [Synechococcus sp. ROS8604]|jgi:1,4-dihydroxy-2-naphthoate octaprenyltransferase|uniref:hypothetical protein n=1 Tax=Synechococcus sp. ROS8604 TaxID=1442557 RepID=UPI001644D0F0|nr:hypothetical protein [Synechococcus sp. ROS8604]QNI90093.1 putative membrane protein [Synechococcus sp. ROS8604]